MSVGKVTVHARVQVTLEIEVPDSWHEDVKLDQVHKQAAEGAIGLLRRGLVVDGMTNTGMATSKEEAARRPQVSLVGKPIVDVVLIREQR
jgi:hypothetical protein